MTPTTIPALLLSSGIKSKSDKSPKVEDTEEKEIVDEVAVDVNLGENEEDSPYKVKSKDKKYLSMPGMENFDEEFLGSRCESA